MWANKVLESVGPYLSGIEVEQISPTVGESSEIRRLHLVAQLSKYDEQVWHEPYEPLEFYYSLGKNLYRSFGGRLYGREVGTASSLFYLQTTINDDAADVTNSPRRPLDVHFLDILEDHISTSCRKQLAGLLKLNEEATCRSHESGHMTLSTAKKVMKYHAGAGGYFAEFCLAMPLAFKDVPENARVTASLAHAYGVLSKALDDLVDCVRDVEKEQWNYVLILAWSLMRKSEMPNVRRPHSPSEINRIVTGSPRIQEMVSEELGQLANRALGDLEILGRESRDKTAWRTCESLIAGSLMTLYARRKRPGISHPS